MQTLSFSDQVARCPSRFQYVGYKFQHKRHQIRVTNGSSVGEWNYVRVEHPQQTFIQPRVMGTRANEPASFTWLSCDLVHSVAGIWCQKCFYFVRNNSEQTFLSPIHTILYNCTTWILGCLGLTTDDVFELFSISVLPRFQLLFFGCNAHSTYLEHFPLLWYTLHIHGIGYAFNCTAVAMYTIQRRYEEEVA